MIDRTREEPYQFLDGGPIVLWAKMTVNLAPLLGQSGYVLERLVTGEVTADLFDLPQRVAFRERIVSLRLQGTTERVAAEAGRMTVTAV
jgi:hypothetical protein